MILFLLTACSDETALAITENLVEGVTTICVVGVLGAIVLFRF